MKDIVDFYTYMFKNFRNQVIPVTICVKSEKIENDSMHTYSASWNCEGDGVPLFRAVSIGIAVYNNEDKWDYATGCRIAEEKADKNSPVLYTATGSVITKEVMEALSLAAFEKFKANPDSVIHGYSKMKAIYEAENNRKTEIYKLNYYEKETLSRMSALKNEGKLDKFVNLA